jgi:hypothetical protein
MAGTEIEGITYSANRCTGRSVDFFPSMNPITMRISFRQVNCVGFYFDVGAWVCLSICGIRDFNLVVIHILRNQPSIDLHSEKQKSRVKR